MEFIGWSVDEVIECLLKPGSPLVARLLELAPTAYIKRVRISAVWNQLTPAERSEIDAGFKADFPNQNFNPETWEA